MLKPIPTPHPAIMFGSLTLISGMMVYEWRSGFHKPGFLVTIFVTIAIASLSKWSRDRRAKEIKAKYSPSTLRKRPDRASFS